MRRVCSQCGTVLNQYHPGNLCYVCEDKQLEKITDDNDLIDARTFAFVLGLRSAESVKRLARKGRLPPRIPGVRKWLWRRSVVEDWIKQEGQAGSKDFRMVARGIASNLRRCRYDSIIRSSLSDEIGGKVYGQEHVFGTADAGRVESITLVKIDRPVALNALEQLPKKDFPELSDITDWADLIYDRINEDLIVRLEAYF